MEDFGGKLRQARERRGLSLRQMAASTKLSTAALEALERNDVSKLPGGIFSRAFVRAYAIEVGLDPERAVREFLDRFHQEAAPAAAIGAVTMTEEEREFQERRRKAARVVAGAAALVLLGGALFFALRARAAARSRTQELSTPPPVLATPSAPAPAHASETKDK
jgi:cytoskeleton protein RodZ